MSKRQKLILLGICLVCAVSFFVWRQTPSLGGAIDIYAKQVIASPGRYPLPGELDEHTAYAVYNLQFNHSYYQADLALLMAEKPDNDDPYTVYLAVQTIALEQHGLGWRAVPLSAFEKVLADTNSRNLLPPQVYSAEYGDFRLKLYRQICGEPDYILVAGGSFDPEPVLHNKIFYTNSMYLEAVYIGSPEDKANYTAIRAIAIPWNNDKQRPAVASANANITGITKEGGVWGEQNLQGDWPNIIELGGGNRGGNMGKAYPLPDAYAVDFYINGELTAQLKLEKEAYQPNV